MKIKIENSNNDEADVIAFAALESDARNDQTILGSHWELPIEGGAYAIISDRVDLVEELQREGYEVDDGEYFPCELQDDEDSDDEDEDEG